MTVFDDYKRRTWEDTDGDISDKQTEHATHLRIPFLTSSHPRWNYVTGIVVEHNILDMGIVPTMDEVEQVGAWLQRYNRYYNPQFLSVMREFAPFDIDGAANLGYLMKRAEDDWYYVKRSWQHGGWWPLPHKEGREPQTLTAILERCFDGWSFIERNDPVPVGSAGEDTNHE